MSEESEKLKNLFGNEELMDIIEKKAGSSDKKDVIEALDLFEENWQELPYGPAHDFIYTQRESQDGDIKDKAEEVYTNSFKEHDEKAIKNVEQIRKQFLSTVLPIQSQMADLSKAFKVSKQMVKVAKDAQVMQQKYYDLPRLNSSLQQLSRFNSVLNKATKNLTTIQRMPTPLLIEPSPILRAENLFSKIPDEALEQQSSFSDVLEKTEEDITEDIDFITDQTHDFTFNYPAYKLLCNLEIYLRYLVQELIIEPNGGNLQSKIPAAILDKWEERQKFEEDNPIVDGGYDLIYYSDFTDIKEILQKGKNHKLFEGVFSQEQFKTVISKLHELDPIRKKIAHYRPLSENEFDRLTIYANDILPDLE